MTRKTSKNRESGRSRRQAQLNKGQNNRRRTILVPAVVTVVTALVVSLVTYFAPGIWKQAKRLHDDSDLAATVLFSDQFDSPAKADASLEFIWPITADAVPRHAVTQAEAMAQGAANAGSTLVRLNVRGISDSRVTIHKIDVIVTRREAPLRGTWPTGEKGGGANVRYLRADLDREIVSWSDADGAPLSPMTVYVTDKDEENFDILAETRTCDCHWRVRLTYTVEDEEPRSIVVGRPDGGDLHTSSEVNAAILMYDACQEPTAPGPPLCSGLPPLPTYE